MNRLSTENLVEPINKDLEFQLQDPFLLYRNGNLGIYSIWFYDKRDCQRIAQLMVKIVKQEADHAQRKTPERSESGRTNGVAEPRSIDIMELLSKAKEDYQRGMAGEARVPAEVNVKTVSDATQRAQNTQPPESAPTGVKQITVEELFGSSLPKEPSLMTKPAQIPAASNDFPSAYIQKQTFPSAAQQSLFITSQFSAQDPISNQQQQIPVLIPSPFVMNPSPVFQSVVSRPEPKSQCSVSPLMPSADTEILAAPPGSTSSPAAPTSFLGQEMVGTLKPAASSVSSGIHKPILAPSFLPSTLVPPRSFQEPKMDVFPQLPAMIKPIPAVPMSPGLAVPGSGISVLLSPSAFQQAVNLTAAAPVAPSAPSESCSASGRAAESLSGPCSKTQLQETLIHLIKNDPDFLGAIHVAYLQSLSKDLSNVKL